MVDSPQLSRLQLRISAFSLIEVTIAMGVMSFCLLTTIGLLPVALTTMRSAMDQTMGSQIMQQIASQATLTPFSQLDDYVKTPLFFDQEGQLTGIASEQRFKVSLEKVNSASISPFPGSQNAVALPSSLYVIKSVISDARAPKDLSPSTYILYVPNSGG